MVQVQHFLLKLCHWQAKAMAKLFTKGEWKKPGKRNKTLPLSSGSSLWALQDRHLIGFWMGSKKILFGFMQWAYRRGEWWWTSTLWDTGVHWDFSNSLKPWKFLPEKDLCHRLSQWHQCSGSASLGCQWLGGFSSSGELRWHPEHTSVVRYCPDHWPALWTGQHFKL